jgi:hypothetical protein
MNIVKLKDILMPEEFTMSEFFNTHLKGKYAYWIQMRYIFPLDSLTYRDYIQYEQLPAEEFLTSHIRPHIDLYSEEYCMIDFVHTFVDVCETEKANNVYNFIASNVHTTDEDIDMNRLRVFRTWLASEILKLNMGLHGETLDNYTQEVIHMLEYYKGGMYNDVIKYLDMFGGGDKSLTELQTNGCGCCSSNISSLYNLADVTVCDPKSVYVGNIHSLMVKTFEDPDFWSSLNRDFVRVVKKYVDNIIRIGFTINRPVTVDKFVDCACSAKETDMSNSILKRFSEALGYIVDEDVTGHVNFINDALYDWAEYLYDYMYWPITRN